MVKLYTILYYTILYYTILYYTILLLPLINLTSTAYAEPDTYTSETVPYTFTSGTTAKSSEVNANFSYLANRSWSLSGSDLYYSGGNVGIRTAPDSCIDLHIKSSYFGSSSGCGTSPKILMNASDGYGSLLLGSIGPYDRSASSDMIPGLVGSSSSSTGHLLLIGQTNSSGDTGTLPVVILSAWSTSSSTGFSGSKSVDVRPLFGVANYTTLKFVIDKSGYVGIGQTTPSYPLHMASGAYVTSGGVWTNASSREYKKDIHKLSSEDAMVAFNKLEPVSFKYKSDDERHVGFIAEDVPDLVASGDRKGLSAMDMVAVLTKVVQEQQKTIASLSKEVKSMKAKMKGDKTALTKKSNTGEPK